MGDIERRTRLARLLIAPPSVVYEELKAYGAEVQASPYLASSDELEASLAGRGDPLIDLALASFGASPEMVGALYKKAKTPSTDEAGAKYKQGLRLAVLANETLGARHFRGGFPERVIGKDEVALVLTSADWVEAETLILNPTIADDVLLALYRGDEVAAGLDEVRRQQLVTLSGRNERLHTCTDDEHGPDLGHYALHRAIFNMLETVPTSDNWRRTLNFLLEQLSPGQVHTQEGVDVVLERWLVDDKGEEEKPGKRDEYTDTGLSERTEFRCLIGALYGRNFGTEGVVICGTADDEDVAQRCAYYGNAQLDVRAMKKGLDKDADSFVYAAMANDNVLLKSNLRKMFEGEFLSGRHLHRYRRRCAQLQRRWTSFDPRPTAEWMIGDAASQDSKMEQQVRGLADGLKEAQKAAALVSWLILALAAVVIWRT